jgi:CBS domain-containing protein
MTIESLLSRPVSTLPPHATCAEAARRMSRQNIGSVVIEENGAPVGVVTDRDLALRVIAEELDPAGVTVGQVMSPFPAFSNAHRGIHEALDVMLEMGVRRLPAVNAKGTVVGMLSLDDILIELAEELGKVKRLLEVERSRADMDNQTLY